MNCSKESSSKTSLFSTKPSASCGRMEVWSRIYKEPWLWSSSYQQSCRWRSWGNLCWGIFLSAATHQRKASSRWSPPDFSGRSTRTHGCPGTEGALRHKDKEHTMYYVQRVLWHLTEVLWCLYHIDTLYDTYLAWAHRASLYVTPSLWPGTETDTDDPEETERDFTLIIKNPKVWTRHLLAGRWHRAAHRQYL